MILVDSSVFIDYFNGIKNHQTTLLDNFLGRDMLVIGDYILAEVLQGFKKDKDYKIAKELLEPFHCFKLCDKEMAIRSAENFRALRKKGITIRKTVDLIIGTFCIENKIELLHNDKDFIPMQKYLGLRTP